MNEYGTGGRERINIGFVYFISIYYCVNRLVCVFGDTNYLRTLLTKKGFF